MKAKANTNRILTTIGFLLLAVTIGHGQDFLAEGSNDIFNFDLYAENTIENYILEHNTDECCGSNSDTYIESELTVENWMVESFSEAIEVEYWMTESFASSLETQLETEEWMTVSFTESSEEEILVEDWMTQSLPVN